MTDEKEKFDRDMERFKIILQTRDFEIEMFWKRCNYFLVLNTALATALVAGLFASFHNYNGVDVPTWFLFGVCVAGAFVCFAWFKVGLGSKFWQSHWEQVAEEMQGSIGFQQDGDGKFPQDYFSKKGPKARVRRNLFPPDQEEEDGCLKTCYNKQVLKKPSVSGWMQGTAFVFGWAWVGGILWTLWEMFG